MLYLIIIPFWKNQPNLTYDEVADNENENNDIVELQTSIQQERSIDQKLLHNKHNQQDLSVLQQFKLLLKNKDFMLVMVSSSIVVSLSYSFPTVLEQVLLPYGYTSRDASIFGVLYMLAGILGGVIASLVLTRDPIFRLSTNVVILGTFITFLFIEMFVGGMTYKEGYWSVLSFIIVNGFINIALYSVCFEYVVYLTPGIGETLSGGCINTLANLLGFLEIIIIQQLIADDKADPKYGIDYAMYTMYGGLIISGVLMCFVKK